MDKETFRPSKRPEMPAIDKPSKEEEMPQPIPAHLPPQLQHALRKTQGETEKYTGNSKLDELVKSLKDYTYEEVTFPSKGKFYNDLVAPSSGIIHVRGMTGEEEQILATQRYYKRNIIVDMLIKHCVRENLQTDNLLLADRTWLTVYLRAISFGTDYEVAIRCTECGSKFSTNVNLDFLDINYCPDDFGPEDLIYKLPKSGFKVAYHFATAREENLISDYVDKRKRQTPDSEDDTSMYRASLLIDEIEGLTDKNAIKILLTKLPIQDTSCVRSLIGDPPFGIDTKVQLKCENCNEGFDIELPYETNFFFPRLRRESLTPVSDYGKI